MHLKCDACCKSIVSSWCAVYSWTLRPGFLYFELFWSKRMSGNCFQRVCYKTGCSGGRHICNEITWHRWTIQVFSPAHLRYPRLPDADSVCFMTCSNFLPPDVHRWPLSVWLLNRQQCCCMAVQEWYLHKAFGRVGGIVLVVNSFLPIVLW